MSLLRARSSANREAGKDIAGVSTKVLAPTDLDRIKKESVILTDDELRQRKKQQEQQLVATRHEAQERKRHMMEKELQVRARREQTAMEMELEAERKALLTNDDVLQHQHLVSMRRINSLALQATGYMACDALQQHHKIRDAVETKYDRLHDQIMEKERVDELQQRAVDAAVAQAKRIEARQMLEQQIADRHKKKMYEEEAKAIEAQKILHTFKQYEAEEQRKVQQRKDQVHVMMAEVTKTNEQINAMKEAQHRREKYEEQVAAAYLRKKAADEEAKLQEEARIRKAKELRVAKLRAQQEKAQDKCAAHDEFRAKKAWEEREMQARRKEQHDRDKREQTMLQILDDRKRQEAFHAQQRAQHLQMEQHLDQLTAERTEDEYRKQQAKLVAARERQRRQGEVLQDQIQENQQLRAKAKLFAANDATYSKKKAMKESIIADKYRRETLARLEKQGVAEEYLRELKRMQITEHNA